MRLSFLLWLALRKNSYRVIVLRLFVSSLVFDHTFGGVWLPCPTTTFANILIRALSIEGTDLKLKKGKEGTTIIRSSNPQKKAKFDVEP